MKTLTTTNDRQHGNASKSARKDGGREPVSVRPPADPRTPDVWRVYASDRLRHFACGR